MTLPRPAPGTLKWWIIGSLGIAASVALVVWFALSATVGLPSWQTWGFKIVDDRTVSVTFDVTRPEGQPMTCTIEALDRDFGRVGSVQFAVPQTETETGRHTATVLTTTRAVTGQVRTCTMP